MRMRIANTRVKCKYECECERERKTIKIGFMVLFVFPQNDSMPQNWIIVLNYDYKVLYYRFNFMSAVGSSCNGLVWLYTFAAKISVFSMILFVNFPSAISQLQSSLEIVVRMMREWERKREREI